MKIKPIPIFSENGGVGFDLLDVVNKVNELVNSHNKTAKLCACNGVFSDWEIHGDDKCYVSKESKNNLDNLRT